MSCDCVEYKILFIHSFIHSGYLYSAPSRNLLRGALSPATVKEKCLKKLAERRHVYSVFLTTTIRRIKSGFNNFYYQCPPLLFTSRSRPIYIIESLVHVTYVIVRHYSPSC